MFELLCAMAQVISAERPVSSKGLMVSFHLLYERHSRQVFRFALFLSGNVATAEDLTSETFVRAWTARGKFREATVAAYLLTITRNLWRDAQRRDWRTVPLEAVERAWT